MGSEYKLDTWEYRSQSVGSKTSVGSKSKGKSSERIFFLLIKRVTMKIKCKLNSTQVTRKKRKGAKSDEMNERGWEKGGSECEISQSAFNSLWVIFRSLALLPNVFVRSSKLNRCLIDSCEWRRRKLICAMLKSWNFSGKRKRITHKKKQAIVDQSNCKGPYRMSHSSVSQVNSSIGIWLVQIESLWR